MNSAAPVLSVVIATNRPWPAIKVALDSVVPEARTVGAEIIVADGTAEGLPAEFQEPDVIVLRDLGASVFRLRARALAHARGEIVAMTEDHCRVRPGWCDGIIRAHREYPHAAAIGGVVENGATKHLIDWASFFVGHGSAMAPVQAGEAEFITGQANLSYKRRVVVREVPERGVMEFLHACWLRDRGEVLVTDDRLIVEHDQCCSFAETSANHFHNGRSIAGFMAHGMRRWTRLRRALATLTKPPDSVLYTVGILRRKRRFGKQAVVSLPFIVWLIFCHTAGEFLGYLLGPGKSPQRLP